MRTATALWAATTLVLAGSNLYFARALHEERAGHDPNGQKLGLQTLGQVASAMTPHSQAGAAAARTSRSSGDPSSEEQDEARRNADFLERVRKSEARDERLWSDPATRPMMLAQLKNTVRTRKPALAATLGLSPPEEESFVALLAEHQREMDEWIRDSYPDQVRDVSALLRKQQEEIAQLLGQEKAQRYQRYEMTLPEREVLRSLGRRLDPANAINEQQATRFVDALYEQRQRYTRDLMLQPEAGGFSAKYPVLGISKDMSPAARLRYAEEEVPRLEAFMRSLHDSAASVLTPEQLRRFDQLQEAQLNSVRYQLVALREEAADPTAATR